jgi:zinc protease
MLKKRLHIVVLLLVLCGLLVPPIALMPGLGTCEATAAPQPSWPHEKSDLSPDANMVFGRLENGFRYVLMQNQKPIDRVSMHLNVQAGSAQETDSQQGLAHFLEHMLFNGSEHFKPGELVKYFQSIGMQFGADANAHTGFFETVYDIFLPDGQEDSFRKGLLVMHDYAEGALLLESEIERERKVILAEKRQRDSASYRTFVSELMFELPDVRISQRLPIGQESVLQQATRSDLKTYYDTWYRPETMVLVVVGSFDVELASGLITEAFSTLSPRAKESPEITFGDVRHRGVQAFHHHEAETGNTTVTIEVLSKEALQADSLARRKERIARRMADQIVQNRLDQLIRTRQAPGTSASIGSGVFANQVAYAMITAEGHANEWQALLGFLELQLRQALAFGFTASELDRVRKDIISDFEQADSQKGTRESKTLARQIIRTLNSDRVMLSPAEEKRLMVPFIQSLTVETVSRAFQKSWAQHHRLLLVTGNSDLSKDGVDPKRAILQVYQKSILNNVSPPLEAQATRFPYLSEPVRMGRVVDKKVHDDLGIVQIDYENGFRLNLKKTAFKDDEILTSLSFGQGRFSEPAEKPGLSELAVAVVNESGLGSLDRHMLETAMAGHQSQVVFGVDESSFVLNGKTNPQELPLLFQLLYAHIVDPGFRKEAFNLAMGQFGNQYEAISHTLDGVMTLQGKRFLAGGDSRFGLPSYDVFKKLRLEDVRNWMVPVFSNSEYELSVVGDFDINRVIDLAGRYFGSRPGIKPNIQKRADKPVFPTGKRLAVRVDTKIPNGLVYVSYATDDIWDIHQTRRLNLLSDVFSERMRVQIREKLGEAYSPFAFNRASRAYDGYGVFNAVVEVDPASTQLVIEEIQKIAVDLSVAGITQDEILRSMEPTLSSIRDMRQRNGYWLKTVLMGSKQHPEKIEWSRSIISDYTAITSEDLQALSKKYLGNGAAAFIVAVPAVAN